MYADHWFGSGFRNTHQKKLESGLVQIEILDQRDNDPDSLDDQLAAIRYIQEHEETIMEALYTAMNEIVNPAHVDYCGDNERVKPMKSYKDLGETLMLSQIQIDDKDGIAYFTIMCEYIGDYENGLVITMYKNEYIGSEASWEVDFEGIAKHRGGYSPEELATNRALSEESTGVLFLTHDKYGELKPWQIDANGNYLSRLIHDESKMIRS